MKALIKRIKKETVYKIKAVHFNLNNKVPLKLAHSEFTALNECRN